MILDQPLELASGKVAMAYNVDVVKQDSNTWNILLVCVVPTHVIHEEILVVNQRIEYGTEIHMW